MDIEENVPLKNLTTFRTGGPVRFLLTAHSEEDLMEAVSFSKKENLPLIPFGSGSNLLGPDAGIAGMFVRTRMAGLETLPAGEDIALRASSGLSWDGLVERSVSEGWWGLENLSAIPGTVGAAVVQNIGAYGAALSEHVRAVAVFDTKEGTLKTFSKQECCFGYRTSVFKREVDRYIITEVIFSLSKKPSPNLSYRDLKGHFEKKKNTPTLPNIRAAVVEIRKNKFPPLSEFGTAGSFFLNPIIRGDAVEVVRARYPGMPLFELPEGGVKMPLAWIFDRTLSLKGARVGKAFLWEAQPLVIAAELGATTKDIVALASRVAEEMYARTNIKIIPEVRMFGEEKNIFQ